MTLSILWFQLMPRKVFGDARRQVRRFASRAEAATVTARQSRLVDRGGLSISSDSSSQSSAESLACSGPNNSVTAPMNTDNSLSSICISSAYIELENDSFVFIGSSSFVLYGAQQKTGLSGAQSVFPTNTVTPHA